MANKFNTSDTGPQVLPIVVDPVALPVSVSGEFFPDSQPVTGAFFPATQPVSGTFFPATQPVSGTLAISNFPGSFAVSNLPPTQPVSGTVGVSNFPATQPVSGTFWPATQPVSGPLTDAQLRAAAVPVSVSNWPNSLLAGTYRRVTASGPTVVKASAGQLMRLIYGGVGSAITVTVYDNTAASGTIVLTWKFQVNTPSVIELNAWFPTGITVSLSAAGDITAVYL